MATITTHVLNGVRGTHAAGVMVSLVECASGQAVFSGRTDGNGRLSHSFEIGNPGAEARYDLVFASGEYWREQGVADETPPAVNECVFRFVITKADGHYHIPVNLSPHSHAVWWSR